MKGLRPTLSEYLGINALKTGRLQTRSIAIESIVELI
jgi:hypothetical protein